MTAVLILLLSVSTPIQSNTSKNRWWIGTGLGYHTTEDVIASNAGTGAVAINSQNDQRPADFINHETTVEDTFLLGVSAGYGLSHWFTLQLDAGYFQGEIGPVDVYHTEVFPTTNSFNPTTVFMRSLAEAVPVIAGDLTEIPIAISGVARFLVDRPFNPYVGVGAGMVFTDIDADTDVSALNSRLDALRIQAVYDDRGREITPAAYKAYKGPGWVPLTHPVTLEVDDAFEVHLMGGLEYFPADGMSIVADVRYTRSDHEIVIDLGGEDQVTYYGWSEGLFRPDGSLKYFRAGGQFPNPYRNNDPNQGFVTCTPSTTGDFDRDGHRDDLCYSVTSMSEDNPVGRILVQGGRIDLSGFTATIGVRFYLP